MGIEETLTGIKTYFLNWHRDNYNTLHPSISNQVTDQLPDKERAVTSGAVYNCAKGIKTDLNSYKNTVNGQISNLDTKINNVESNIKTASYGTLPHILSEYETYHDSDSRGYNWPDLPSNARNGFMTAKEKMDLYYYGRWFEITGKQIASEIKTTKHMTMWVNLGLRLVYFNFSYKNCPWLKKAYKDFGYKEWYTYPAESTNQVWLSVRPISHVWAPTNNPNIVIGVTADGGFYIRSRNVVKKNTTIHGSLMWYYRDSVPSVKVGVLGTR